MVTINTADDLIDVLRSDDRVRSAVRRELLTEEVLALPAQFGKMVEAQTAMQDAQTAMQKTQTEMLESIQSLQKTQTEMLETQTEMLESIQSLQKTQTEMLETQNEILEEIKGLKEGQRDAAEHRAILQKTHREEHDAMHRFRGNYAIDAARKNRVAIAEEFAQLENLTDIDVEVLDEARLREMRNKNQEALVALGISAKERNSFHTADLALEVARIGEDSRPEYYIAVEASYTGTSDDIEHAAVRARMLGAITGCKAYAVVAAVKPNRGLEGRVIRDAGKYVASDDGSAAFWYQIADKELEPRPPR